MRKYTLHFRDAKHAEAFKEAWESFASNMKHGSIEQKGNTCILSYNCGNDKVCQIAPNSIFRGCQHCG